MATPTVLVGGRLAGGFSAAMIAFLLAATCQAAGQPLSRAQRAYAAGDFERAAAQARVVLDSSTASSSSRVDAHRILASSLVIIGHFVAAEKEFRLLSRMAPDFELPRGTSPKIVAVYRKVQAEEQELRAALERAELDKTRLSIELTGALPKQGRGGEPLPANIIYRDPRGAIARVELHYRTNPASAYLTLPLERSPTGSWSAMVDAATTSNEDGAELTYFVRAFDHRKRELAATGTASEPLSVDLAPGTNEVPFYKRAWFWSLVGGAAAAIAGASAWAIHEARQPPQSPLGVLHLD